MVIVINALVMAINLEYQGLETADAVGISPDGGEWPSAEEAFLVFEHIFTVFFVMELVIKLVVYRCNFFTQGWNVMDFLIVCSAILDTYILPHLKVTGSNISFMRLLRIAKIIKVLRIVRVLRAFAQLRVLLVAIASSFPALGWSMALMSILQLIAAIFMTQTLQGWLRDENNDQAVREFVFDYFGTFSRSAMTMLEMTLAPGVWTRFGRIITYEVNGAYMIFFFLYSAGVSFAIVRVISAIFLKETLQAAAKDHEMVMAEINRHPEFISSIRQVFDETDSNQNGHITLIDLNHLLHDERSSGFLHLLGLQKHEILGMFHLMDDGDHQITFAEFLAGVMRLKAKGGVDLVTLLYENKRLLTKILEVEELLKGSSLKQWGDEGSA
eukprot:gnl/MRDRNA2_/MRDRNA2_66430_c0_seq1.p1 gnl/MRDRNA2_/MRDRNA2_66430_c0~~gnl/MRDRNA2_/MRDRNA2_66430_c0_seq1.p1  ORF type:complete len:384 (+),score=55.27 gnl/MRDRNA2_/MRDRNA2_66430_c0_seq1:271-1422(+)